MMSSTTDITSFFIIFVLVSLLWIYLKAKTYTIPNSPPQVPYIIPWIGHGISFALRRETLMKSCHAQFGPIYQLLVAGQKITVVSSPELLADLVGKSPKQVHAPEENLLQATSGLQSRLPYITMILRRNIYGIISRRLTKPTMGPITVPINQRLYTMLNNFGNQHDGATIHLGELIQQSMYQASVSVLFGDSLPDTYTHFHKLDQWMYYGVSRIPVMHHLVQMMHNKWATAILPYINKHWESDDDTGYIDGASTFMSECLQELKSADLNAKETSHVIIGVLWGFHAQSIQVATNAIAFLISNPIYCAQLATQIRTTIDKNWPDFETFLIAEPEALDSPGFEQVQSVVNETLRLSSLATVFRIPDIDIELVHKGHRYTIQQGDYIAGDAYSLHHDKTFYPNPEEFDGDRFLNKPPNNQARGFRTFVPWGGGTFICKGREFGEYQVLLQQELLV
ncbi:cytochrome P450 [Lentinula raphanica]|nr:cytochrome P450 [Lentinula raphanica]